MLKKIKNIFLNVIIVFFAICLLSDVVTYSITGSATIFGYKPMIVMSGSMIPVLHKGQIIIGKPINSDTNLKKGDIVCYYYKHNGLCIDIVHRIININSDGTYTIKGDNNDLPDPYPVSITQIKYKIIS